MDPKYLLNTNGWAAESDDEDDIIDSVSVNMFNIIQNEDSGDTASRIQTRRSTVDNNRTVGSTTVRSRGRGNNRTRVQSTTNNRGGNRTVGGRSGSTVIKSTWIYPKVDQTVKRKWPTRS